MSEEVTEKAESPPAPRKGRRWVVGISVVLVALLGMVLLLPYGMNWKFQQWLEEQGLEEVRLENVDFNPFLLRLSFDGLHGVRSETEDRLEVGHGALDLAWGAFWQRKIRVQRAALRDAVITVANPAEARMRIGGLVMGEEERKEEIKEEAALPWLWGCEEIELDNVQIRYRDPRGEAPLTIVHTRLENLGNLNPDRATSFEIELEKTDGSVFLDGTAQLFAEQASLTLTLKIRELGLGWTAPFLGEALAEFDGRLSTPQSVELTFRQTGEGPRVELRGGLVLDRAGGRGEGFRLQPLDLDWDGTVFWEAAGGRNRWLADGRLTAAGGGVILEETGLSILADRLEYVGEVGSGEWEQEGAPGLRLKGEGSVTRLLLEQEGRGNLLEVGSLSLSDLGWENPETLTSGRVGVAGLKLFERVAGSEAGEGETTHFLSLKSAELDAARLSGWQELRGDRLNAGGLEGFLAWDADGSPTLSRWFGGAEPPAEEQADTPAPEAEPDDSKGGFVCSIGRVEIGGGSRLVLEDRSVAPTFRLSLDSLQASLTPLEMIETGKTARLQLETRPGEYASLSAGGMIQPFTDPLSLDIEGELKSLDLARLTAYAQKHLGYRLKSGHLYVDYAAAVDQGQLEGELKIMASKLELEDAPSEAEKKVREELGVPLPKALSMIKDGDGNINLTLNLSGAVEDPDFQLSGIISAALIKALKTGIVSYYAPMGVTLLTGASLPLGAAFLATKLFDMATTLRFDPVVFEPMEANLGKGHQERMETLVGLVADRPKVKLAVCGVATGADLARLRMPDPPAKTGEKEEDAGAASETGENQGAGKAPPEPTAEERDRLLGLAEARAAAIKAFLVDKGIDAARLFLCSPEIQLEEGVQPRVELAI